MDALKEHRLLLTLIGGVALSVLVYMMVTAPARETSSQDLLEIDEQAIERVESQVRRVPNAGHVRLREEQRSEALRELYELYRLYLEWGRPLLTYDVPGANMGSVGSYRAQVRSYLEEMQTLYGDPEDGIEGFLRPVPVEDGDIRVPLRPFERPQEGQDNGLPWIESREQIELNRKQFWVLFELMQIMREVTHAVENETGERPYFQVDRLQLPGVRDDGGRGLYQGIPFELSLRASVEVWPRLIFALYESPVDEILSYSELEEIYESNEREIDVINLGQARNPGDPSSTNRIGLRFDRLTHNVQTGPIPEEFSVRLDRNEVAQAIFLDVIEEASEQHWNEDNGRVIAPPLDQRTLRRIERIADEEERRIAMDRAVAANEERFRDRMIEDMYERLRAALGPEPSYLNIVIFGEAIDFLHDPESEAVRFWDRLELSTDDVVEMLKRGTIEEGAEGADCDFFENVTTPFKPVYVPFEMTVETDHGPMTLDPYTEYRLSEQALRLVAEQVRPEENQD